MQDLKTDLRKEIEALLQQHPQGLSAMVLAQRTGAELDLVRSIIGRLRDKLKLRPEKRGKNQTQYIWMNQNVSAAKSNGINKMEGRYLCPELRPFTGRPGCNQHEQFGSRIGNTIFHRDGTIEKL